MSPRECTRLMGFPETFKIPPMLVTLTLLQHQPVTCPLPAKHCLQSALLHLNPLLILPSSFLSSSFHLPLFIFLFTSSSLHHLHLPLPPFPSTIDEEGSIVSILGVRRRLLLFVLVFPDMTCIGLLIDRPLNLLALCLSAYSTGQLRAATTSRLAMQRARLCSLRLPKRWLLC